MVKLFTKIGNIRMETPLIAVSGIYGTDYEFLMPSREYVGAVVTKSVTLEPRLGNQGKRIVEVPVVQSAKDDPCKRGLINAIGLQNPGIQAFISQEIPRLRKIEAPIIASVAGSTIEEYTECSDLLAAQDEIDGIELNVSCPNVELMGMEFGCDPRTLERLVSSVRKVLRGKTLLVKLTPNVTDIVSTAEAAIRGGADALSLINTLRAMAIDIEAQTPILGNKTGGLSGEAIHPVAVYMIRECYITCCRRANVPIVGIGGVTSYEEAVEFILAGATGVGIGTAVFRDSGGSNADKGIFQLIAEGIDDYLTRRGKTSIGPIVGLAAPEQLFSYQEIAEYLNTTEDIVRSLAGKGFLPGAPSRGRWQTTLNELENWYGSLSGNKWAELTAGGNLNPISVDLDVAGNITRRRLSEVLENWDKGQIVKIMGRKIDRGNSIFELVLIDPYRNGKQKIENLQRGAPRASTSGRVTRLNSVRNRLTTAFQSEFTSGTQLIIVSLSSKGILTMKTKQDLGEIPERDREIVRFFLATYAERLARELPQYSEIGGRK
jgi:dihydroorotate dehydrogenase (NAD+) catalytic subunit